MVDFDALLKKSLGAANDRFKKADEELRSFVVAGNDSLEKATHGRLKLKLSRVKESSEGINYRLDLINSADKKFEQICGFQVPISGYPIKRGRADELGYIITTGELQGNRELEEYFKTCFQIRIRHLS